MSTEIRRPAVYRPERAEGVFDAIVIGSGMGGLSTAALLSQAGKRVLVLERHYTMGGFTHSFRRKQYEWDVGVHFVGEFHRQGTLPSLLIDDISGGRLEWAPMPARSDRFVFPDATYEYVAGREHFVDELARAFPSERKAIARYVELCDEAYAAAMPFFQQKALPPVLAPLTRPMLCRRFLKLARRTTLSVLRELTDDPRLIGVLTGTWGTYGLPPAESSFGIHGLVASHYLDGAAYPVGGSSAIARSILPTIEASRGRLLVHAEVEEILVRGSRCVGVRMADGQELEAPVVLSDAGVANTFGWLLNGETRTRFDLEDRLRQTEPSVSHLCLYVGFNRSTSDVGLEATNLWVYPSYDHDRNVEAFKADPDAPLPAAYISFPSAKDPAWAERQGQTATLEIMTFTPYEWFEPWEDERWRKRGEEYEALKARFAQRLLAMLYEHVPQTRGKVDYSELSTPLSTRHFSGHPHGEIYGLAPTPDRFGLRWLGPHTPIRGLYMTGQDAVAHGVVGALLGGVVAASAVLRRNVIKDVRRRRGETTA
jgi:all-trans-retinol 13,14-reductase